jgi:hypothetical protein
MTLIMSSCYGLFVSHNDPTHVTTNYYGLQEFERFFHTCKDFGIPSAVFVGNNHRNGKLQQHILDGHDTHGRDDRRPEKGRVSGDRPH